MRVTDIKFDRNKRGIARSGCVGWTGARSRSLNDNYSCLSYQSQRGWVVKNFRRLFGSGFVCAHKADPKSRLNSYHFLFVKFSKDFLRTITYIECQELKGISIVRGINI